MGHEGPFVAPDESRAAQSGQFPARHAPSGTPHNVQSEDCESDLNLAIVRLYEAHADSLLRYAMAICGDSELAQDAVQEAFLRYYIACRKESTWGNPKGWLYSTARNYILDRLKEYYARNARSLNTAADIADHAGGPEAQLLFREIGDAAQGLLSRREMECLRLRSDGLRYQEIADLLAIESATVGVLLGRALKKIRGLMNDSEGGE